jgi:hypothetical protein
MPEGKLEVRARIPVALAQFKERVAEGLAGAYLKAMDLELAVPEESSGEEAFVRITLHDVAKHHFETLQNDLELSKAKVLRIALEEIASRSDFDTAGRRSCGH